MPKRMIRPRRPSFVQQAKMRHAKAAGTYREEPSQSKGVRLSRDGRRLIMNRSERRWTAYHEAGHAVIDAVLGIRFLRVTIVPWKHMLGRVERRRRSIGLPHKARQPRVHVERAIVGTLAGGIAERLARRDGRASGLAEDYNEECVLTRLLPGTRSRSGGARRLDAMQLRAETFVQHHWNAIDQVALRLIRDRTLKECEVLTILRQEKLVDALAGMNSSDEGVEYLLHKAVAALGHVAGTCPGEVQDESASVSASQEPAPGQEIANFIDALLGATEAHSRSNGR
jgi:hypothetical protein